MLYLIVFVEVPISMKDLRYLVQYFFKYKWLLFFGLIFVTLANYFKTLQPKAVRQSLDLIVEHLHLYRTFDGFELQAQLYSDIMVLLFYFGAAIILFACLMGLFMYWMRQTIIVMSHYIIRDLRAKMYAQYQLLATDFYKRNKTGDLMARITEDISKVRMFVGPIIMYSANLILLFVLVIYSMFSVSVELSCYALIGMPLLLFSILRVRKIINVRSTKIQEQLSHLSSVAQEAYSGVRLVKSYAQEEAMIKLFKEDALEYKKRSLGLSRVDAFLEPLTILLTGSSTIITIYIGGLLVIQGELTQGNIAEFIIYINMLTWPVSSIGWIASMIEQAAASQKRINEFLAEETSIKNIESNNLIKEDIKGDIVFDNVSFVYPDTGIKALDNISFHIKAGEKVAIVGRTGGGKTSIAELLLRLYNNTEGEILIDNQPIKQYDLFSLRNQIGYVPQDVFLFSDTVGNNINFAGVVPDNDEATILKYARYAAIEKEVLSLPQGLNTMVGERGVSLSGGQKQRISIARALMKSPNLIILDDSLSAVDNITESTIAQSLNEVCTGKTSIIITHRLYTAIKFDKIIVMEAGKIVQMGTHEELIKIPNTFYAEVYEQQKSQSIQDNTTTEAPPQ